MAARIKVSPFDFTTTHVLFKDFIYFFFDSDRWRSCNDLFFANVLTNSLRLFFSILLDGELSDNRDCNDKSPVRNLPVLYGSPLVPLFLSRKDMGEVMSDLSCGVSLTSAEPFGSKPQQIGGFIAS